MTPDKPSSDTKKRTAVSVALNRFVDIYEEAFGCRVKSQIQRQSNLVVSVFQCRRLKSPVEAYDAALPFPWWLINTCQQISEWAGLCWLTHTVSWPAHAHKQRLYLCWPLQKPHAASPSPHIYSQTLFPSDTFRKENSLFLSAFSQSATGLYVHLCVLCFLVKYHHESVGL